MSSAQATASSIASSAPVAPVIAQSAAAAADKPKPCCVCKDEKAKRDECMLFSKAADPQKDCLSTIDQYRSCMAGFGFKV
ncbi:Cytochrome c oxidase copper chaperone [Podospora pseudocomata]|uniref:Cytochrome c oxidase copper chaperone n=1 Tax=Podospora pseudocomata TaxID=2093779 RepID=A0ABR0GUC0_9PEZI|nr:Cytochrome c oxidase copper chaperone [Podospora pseudocomata]